MGEVMREAAFSLAEAKFAAGDFRYEQRMWRCVWSLLCHLISLCVCFFSTTVIQNVNKAQVKVRAKKDNVAGLFNKSWPIPTHQTALFYHDSLLSHDNEYI